MAGYGGGGGGGGAAAVPTSSFGTKKALPAQNQEYDPDTGVLTSYGAQMQARRKAAEAAAEPPQYVKEGFANQQDYLDFHSGRVRSASAANPAPSGPVASRAAAPLPSTGAAGGVSFGNMDIMSSLQGMLGGGGLGGLPAPSATGAGSGSASVAGTAGLPATPDISATAQTDPRLTDYLGKVKERVDNPEGPTKRAMALATSNIRDAAEGTAKGLKADQARRGVLSASSVPELTAGRLNEATNRNIAGASANIALGREAANDQFLQGALPAYKAPGEAERADKSQALSVWEAGQQNQRAAESAQIQKYLGTLDVLSSLMRL